MTTQRQTDWGLNRRALLKAMGAAGATGFLGGIPGTAVGQQTQPEPCADVLYGIENTQPAVGAYEMEARIWMIDVTTGTVGLIDDQLAPVNGDPASLSGAITANFNGAAWDEQTGGFYFSDYQRLGPDGENPLPSPLYFNDLAGYQEYAGQLLGAVAGAAFSDGVYFYISQRTDDLRAVTFLSDWTVDEDVHVADVLNDTDALGVGDIAIRDGVLYGSATRISDDTGLFFKVALDGSGFETISTGARYGMDEMQLAFAGDGTLYGANSRAPYELFSIDTTTGDTTFVAELPVSLSDLATGPRGFGCPDCDEPGLIAAYEFEAECVNYDLTDEMCVEWTYDFSFTDGADTTGTSVSPNAWGDDLGDPVWASFDTPYPELYAVVKAGPFANVQGGSVTGGAITLRGIDEEKSNEKRVWSVTHAISHVAFYCTADAANAALADLHGVKETEPYPTS